MWRLTHISTPSSPRRIGADSKPSVCCQFLWAEAQSFSFAPAEEINKYFISVARKYGLYDHIQFNSQVSSAVWNEDRAQWSIEVMSKGSSKPIEVQADVFVNASGILNDWTWPDIEGLSSFEGTLIHTASWVCSPYLPSSSSSSSVCLLVAEIISGSWFRLDR